MSKIKDYLIDNPFETLNTRTYRCLECGVIKNRQMAHSVCWECHQKKVSQKLKTGRIYGKESGLAQQEILDKYKI